MWNRLKGDEGEASSGGASLLTILFVVFLVLKLTHVIHWSWIWVFAPLIPAAFLWLLVIAFVAFAFIAVATQRKKVKTVKSVSRRF